MIPARCTRRVPCSMKNSTYRRRRNTVSTWKKSTARIVLAWACQERPPGLPGPPGCGIDARVLEDLPHRRRRDLVAQAGQLAVDAPVAPARVIPGHLQHQRADGLRRARAVRERGAGTPSAAGPGWRASAAGSAGRRSGAAGGAGRLGSSRASAARTARSAQDSLGVLTWRWSTATWWRRIRISASLARSDRASKASQPNTRSTAR